MTSKDPFQPKLLWFYDFEEDKYPHISTLAQAWPLA